jgi:hypothetical protein
LTKLEKLSLWDAQRTGDDALAPLAAMKQLRWLDLSGTQVTPAGVAKLKAANPRCEVLSK